ncbi:Putative membrane protein [Burkholderia gladioli]|nr:Putative membrane protein [Burkholderia gladioli]
MSWIGDRLLLILTAVIGAAACWLVIRATGEWFPTIMLVISYVVLFAENSRLRKLLEKNGISPRPKRTRQ